MVTRIRTARKPVRIRSRKASTSPAVEHGQEKGSPSSPSVVDHLKASPYLQEVVGCPAEGREKHREQDLLRWVLSYLLDGGRTYPRVEVVEVLQAFTGCSPIAAQEALQVLLLHGVVTAVNEVIAVTW